jgi:hypothetical protein
MAELLTRDREQAMRVLVEEARTWHDRGDLWCDAYRDDVGLLLAEVAELRDALRRSPPGREVIGVYEAEPPLEHDGPPGPCVIPERDG